MSSPATNTLPRDIDFLPAAYREAGMQRTNLTLCALVVTIFVVLVTFAAMYQQHMRIVAQEQLAALVPSYQQAQAETKRLADLQQLLHSVEKQAELCTYLRHPWPRSQIVAVLTEQLPEEIELKELSIAREPLAIAGSEPLPAKLSEAAQAKLDPAQRDLAALRDQWDRTRIVVKLAGETDDPLALHRYLEDLDHSVLFTKVDVVAMERMPGDSVERIHFTAKIFLRPGYGQPNGPMPGAEAVSTTTNEQ